MKHGSTFYTADRRVWRNWLEENYRSAEEVWFVFPAKASGEPALAYNDAVEEALCFGWIDSTTGHLDALHGLRRFSPRRPGSSYSRPNIERLIWLDAQGMLLPEVKKSVRSLLDAPYIFPDDILAALRENPETWKNYEGFSEAYQRIRVAYIDAARARPEEFEKRLRTFLSKTKANKKIVGYGGIEKYYK